MHALKIDYRNVPWKAIKNGANTRIRYKPVKLGDFGGSMVSFESGVDEVAHSHPEGQLVFCIRGRIEFTLVDDGVPRKEMIEAGDVLAIPAGVVHAARSIEETMLIVAWSPMTRFDADAIIV